MTVIGINCKSSRAQSRDLLKRMRSLHSLCSVGMTKPNEGIEGSVWFGVGLLNRYWVCGRSDQHCCWQLKKFLIEPK